MSWPFNKYPGSDYETFNYDWVIGKLKKLKDSVAAALASEKAAAESANAASGAMGLAMLYRNAAKNYRDEAGEFAADAADSIDQWQAFETRLVTAESEIDNLINGSTPDADAELINIRTGYTGYGYDTAGNAVRSGDLENQTLNAMTGAVHAFNVSLDADASHTKIKYIPMTLKEGDYKATLRLDQTPSNAYRVRLASAASTSNDDMVVNLFNPTASGTYEILFHVSAADSLDITHLVIFTNNPANALTSEIDFIDLQKYNNPERLTYSPAWIGGGIDSQTGEANTNQYRSHTDAFMYRPEFLVLLNTTYAYAIDYYDIEKHFLGAKSWFSGVNTPFVNIDDVAQTYGFDEWAYVKFTAMIRPNGDQVLPGGTIIYGTDMYCIGERVYQIPENVAGELETLANNVYEKRDLALTVEFLKKQALSYSVNTGCCVVDYDTPELWTFTVGEDDFSAGGRVYIYDINPVTMQLTFKRAMNHNIGHVNSVSYNKQYDTLVIGNGSSAYNLAGAIYLVKNAHSKTSLTAADADIVIPFTDRGAKVNAVWGVNYDADDVLYILTNDSHDFTAIQLGIANNDLGEGSYTEGVTTGFNGSYKTLHTAYWGQSGIADYPNVVQGMTWYKNRLVWGYGHNNGPVAVRCAKINNTQLIPDTYQETFYDSTGAASTETVAGVASYKDKLLVVADNKMYTVKLD